MRPNEFTYDFGGTVKISCAHGSAVRALKYQMLFRCCRCTKPRAIWILVRVERLIFFFNFSNFVHFDELMLSVGVRDFVFLLHRIFFCVRTENRRKNNNGEQLKLICIAPIWMQHIQLCGPYRTSLTITLSQVAHYRFPRNCTENAKLDRQKCRTISKRNEIIDFSLKKNCISRRDLWFFYIGKWPAMQPVTSRLSKMVFVTYNVVAQTFAWKYQKQMLRNRSPFRVSQFSPLMRFDQIKHICKLTRFYRCNPPLFHSWKPKNTSCW